MMPLTTDKCLFKYVLAFFVLLLGFNGFSRHILIPMDEASQKDHLKAYGIAYWVLEREVSIQWLLNYRGGSFLMPYGDQIERECIVRGVSYDLIADVQASQILAEIASPEVNMDAIKLEKAPKIAVYSPQDSSAVDDAVTLALTYAEIPYDVVYDKEVAEQFVIAVRLAPPPP